MRFFVRRGRVVVFDVGAVFTWVEGVDCGRCFGKIYERNLGKNYIAA